MNAKRTGDAAPTEVRRATPSPRQAMVYSFGQRYLAFVMQLGTSIILARLLSPLETGVFSLAAAAVAVGTILREFGTADYVVSQKHISPDKLRAAYTVTVGFAWATAAVLFLAAYPLARQYGEPGVASVMHLLCLNFLLVPLGSTSMALLTKELRFDTLFWIQTTSVLIGAIVTLLCALNGSSYNSPAWGSVAGIATTVLILFVRQPGSVFMLPGFSDLRHVLRFGGTLTVARIIESLANRSADFIVSGMLGFHASGILSKANSLNGGFYDFFASAILRVATPVLAQARHRETSIIDGYSRATVLMASAQWLFFGVMAVIAHELVSVLFGASWLEAVPLLQIAAAISALYAPFMLCSPLLTACGESRALLRINSAFGISLVITLVVGSFYSVAMALALSAFAHVLRIALFARATHEVCSISASEILKKLRPTIALGVFTTALTFVVRRVLIANDVRPVVILMVAVMSGGVGFLAMAALTNHPLIAEIRRAWSSAKRAIAGSNG